MGIVDRLQARRRYRRMAGQLAELDRVDRLYGLGARAPVPARRTRRPRIDSAVGVALAVVLLFLAPAVPRLVTMPGVPEPAPAGDSSLAEAGYPPLPADASHRRVLPPVHTAATGVHEFLATTPGGDAVTFDPCRPIHYVVNPAGMPDGGAQLLREAVAEVSAATGLAFVDDGFTSERLVEFRELVEPQWYGERWAPVLIAWPDDEELAFVGQEVAGAASSYPIAPTGPESERYVTGWVGLERTWFAEALADPETAPVARGVLLHELGHLVGLDHVDDPGEVMHETSATVGLGPGDRQGLAAVGAGDCHTDT